MLQGLGRTVAEGMAWGTGTAIAREAVGSLLGGGSSRGAEAPAAQPAPLQSAPENADPCYTMTKAFTECMTQSHGDMGACQHWFDAVNQCKLNQRSSSSFA